MTCAAQNNVSRHIAACKATLRLEGWPAVSCRMADRALLPAYSPAGSWPAHSTQRCAKSHRSPARRPMQDLQAIATLSFHPLHPGEPGTMKDTIPPAGVERRNSGRDHALMPKAEVPPCKPPKGSALPSGPLKPPASQAGLTDDREQLDIAGHGLQQPLPQRSRQTFVEHMVAGLASVDDVADLIE